MCKISIIVPVYNVEDYIQQCIESILSQSFNEFELIMVNDGSTDRSGIICEEYSKIDKRIKIINKHNGGLSSARNVGIDNARGDYIAFVDSDDYICKDMYSVLYDLITRNNVDIAQCNFRKVFYDNFNEENEKNNFELIDRDDALKNLIKHGEKHVQSVVVWNKLYKRELFKSIRFPEGKIHEDEFTTYKLFDKSKNIVLSDRYMYYYRQVRGSIMNSQFSKKRLDYLEALKQQLNYFERTNIKIYIEVMLRYELSLKIYYFKTEQFIDENSDILTRIKKEYRCMFIKFLKNKNVSIRNKCLNIFFFLSPIIYKNIQNIRKKQLY